MRKLLLAGGTAVAAVAVVTSTASTASNTGLVDRTVGFNQVDITGATVLSFDYVLDGSGANISAVELAFQEDLMGQQIQYGFGPSGLLPCVTGTVDPADDDTDTDGVVMADNNAGIAGTIATCELVPTQSTTTADEFRLVVKTPAGA